MPTSASDTPNPARAASPLWTLLLGVALVRLVTARRRDTVGEVMFGRPVADSHRGKDAERVAATEKDRGRAADKPGDIPAKGWKDILFRVYEEINSDRILAVAAGVTFYGLLAVFPALAALVSLYGLFADAGTINEHLATLSGLLPGGALDVVGEQVKRITSKPAGTLGFAFFSGLAISLWSANAGMKAMFDALDIAYDEDEKRNFFWLNVWSLAFTLGGIVFVLLAIAGIVVLPIVLKYVWFGKIFETLLPLLRWPILYALVVGGLAVLYRYGPSRDRAQWRWITWGSGIAAALWLGGSMLFSWYVSSFGNYNETYGSLGAVIGFMTWIWLSTTIVLAGAELNAEMEHQTAEDTTAEGKKPLGQRGAKMADTVGAAKA